MIAKNMQKKLPIMNCNSLLTLYMNKFENYEKQKQKFADKMRMNERVNKDIHTVQEYKADYDKKNHRRENVEKYITKHTRINSGSISYRVSIMHNDKKYAKTYSSLEQARIFRNTILKHFNQNNNTFKQTCITKGK